MSKSDNSIIAKEISFKNLFFNGNFARFPNGVSGAVTHGAKTNLPDGGWVGNNSPSLSERIAGVDADPCGANGFVWKIVADGNTEGALLPSGGNDVKIKPSTTYTFAFWYKTAAVGDLVWVDLRSANGAVNGTTHYSADIGGSTAWKLFILRFTSDTDADNIRLQIYTSNGDTLYFTNMRLFEGVELWGYVPNADDDRRLGAWESKSDNTVYQAPADGIVCGFSTGGSAVGAYTDGSNPPTTLRSRDDNSNGVGSVTMAVRKGDYWKVTGTTTLFWIPLGAN